MVNAVRMSAVSGCEDAKLALMLLAVEPRLRGALIASGPGTFKSLLARSFETILPRTSETTGRMLVEVPLNVTEDRLLGGIDIELSLSTGKRERASGLLAQADGRALYVDEINLLDPALINHIAAALDFGLVRLEREGISDVYSSEFVLVGTYDTAECDLSPVVRDRVGLIVHQKRETETENRARNLDRMIRSDPDDFESETVSIVKAIEEARARLPRVTITREAMRQLSSVALELGVRGNRTDIFALRAARAGAALAGRTSVDEDDLLLAINLVLLPRATRMPEIQEHEDNRTLQNNETDRGESGSGSGYRELIIKAADSRVALDLPPYPSARSSRAVSGKRARSKSVTAGRYVSSTPSRSPGARVAIDATLRAAAPHQPKRKRASINRVAISADDLRFKVLKRRAGMLIIFAVDASGSMAINRMAQAKGAMTRLLEKAYLRRDRVAFISFRGEEAKVLLRPTRSVTLGKRLVDALPAGGATPLSKGLLAALDVAMQARLQDKTDTLLLVFTDGRANVGLRTGHITDKVEREAAIQEELKKIGGVMHLKNVHPVIIDTRAKFVSGGEGRALARILGARYLYLPRSDAASISSEVARLANELDGR